MTPSWKRLIGVCAVCLTAVGCGGGGGGGPATVSDFCHSYNYTLNANLVRCLKVPKDAISTLYGETDAQICNDMIAAVQSKRATYDPSAAQKCLDALNNVKCADYLTSASACLNAITGQVADGGKCYADMDCKTASYCSGVADGTCPGTCTAYVGKDGDCSQGQLCNHGFHCDGSVCQQDLAKGASCGNPNGPYCLPLLYCTGTNGNTGTCQPQKGPGASCSGLGQCLEGFTCKSGKCTALLDLGKACTLDSECGFYTHCEAGKCTEDPGTGGTCGFDSQQGIIECIGSWCKITNQTQYTGVCTAYLGQGDTCSTTDFGSCGADVCDGSTSKCVAACIEPSK